MSVDEFRRMALSLPEAEDTVRDALAAAWRNTAPKTRARQLD